MKLSDKAQASLDKVVKQFENGDLSPIAKVALIHLDDRAPASHWTFSNRVLAFAQSGELDCRGYHQWQEVGRQVKKGTRAAFILRPNTVKKTHKNQDGNEEEYRACIGFSSIPVFPASGTEGDTPLPEYAPAQLPPLAEVAKQLGIEISWQPLPEDRYGDCDTNGKQIRLGTNDPAVFFHELAHAAHAKIENGLKGGQNKEQETIAEFTAAILMEMYDIRSHSGNAWRYIKMYTQDPLQAVIKALSTIEKVLNLLLGNQAEPITN